MNIGMSREYFLDNFFEKKPLHAKGAFLNEDIEWWHINNALFSWNPGDGLIQLYSNGLVSIDKYTETTGDLSLKCSRISKDTFYEYLNQGATLVLNRIDTKVLPIHHLTLKIAKFVGEKAVANGYIAFGGDGTFGKHWDTHDVFAVQLMGRKRWRVYPPSFQLPLPHQKSKGHKHECPCEPIFDEILERGDALYIPRGWWHEAIPLENEETMHVAVGIHTLKVVDYLNWLQKYILGNELSFRKTLKFEEDGNDVLLKASQALQNAWKDSSNLLKFKDAQVEQERVNSEFCIESIGKNSELEYKAIADFSINSVYKRSLNSSSKIKINGISISVDAESQPLMQEILCENYLSISTAIATENAGKIISLIDGLYRYDVISKRQIYAQHSRVS